jgi:hypothetical protein
MPGVPGQPRSKADRELPPRGGQRLHRDPSTSAGSWMARRLLFHSTETSQMDDAGFTIMTVAETRKALTNGEVRSEVAFQNDVNRLLASLDDLWDPSPSSPFAALLSVSAASGTS